MARGKKISPVSGSAEMGEVERLYAAGDAGRARKLAAALASSSSLETSTQARAFLERTGFPPMGWTVAGVAALLLAAMVLLAILRG